MAATFLPGCSELAVRDPESIDIFKPPVRSAGQDRWSGLAEGSSDFDVYSNASEYAQPVGQAKTLARARAIAKRILAERGFARIIRKDMDGTCTEVYRETARRETLLGVAPPSAGTPRPLPAGERGRYSIVDGRKVR